MRQLSRKASALFALCILATPCMAQDMTPAVDAYIQTEMRQAKIPGVSIAVIKDGRIVLAKGYGLANVEHQVPVKPETVLRSWSISEQFASAIVMMLVERGQLTLDDKLGKFFREGTEAWRNITIRHLLTHTGGTTDYPPDFDMRR